MPYSSNLSDAEWAVLEPHLRDILPKKKRTRPSNWSQREIVDGILYQLKNGCNWNDLPRDFPPYSTVRMALQAMAECRCVRPVDGDVTWGGALFRRKKSRWTTLIIIDSQAVKNTCNASAASNGFCFYKATNGIKRHLAVDSLGNPFFTHCTRANVSDDQGLIEMLTDNIDYFRQKPSELVKTTIMLDHGYHPETIQVAKASKSIQRL